MIPQEEGWHYQKTKNKLESHKKLYESKDFCNVVMPSENTKILEFNQYRKSDNISLIIYTDLDSLIKKIDGCKNNPEKAFTTNASEDIRSGFSITAISSFISMMYTEVKIAWKSFVNP